MACKRGMCIKRTRSTRTRTAISCTSAAAGAAGFSKVLLVEEVDGAPWSNHRQGGGEHEAQFLVGVT